MLPRLVSPRRGRVQWRRGGQTRTPVASGRGVFEVVGGGEGVDFEIAVGGECHGFGDSWSVRRKGDCPAVKSKGEKTASGEPCKARLTEREQVRCVWEFVSGGGDETETCEGAFERVDIEWSRYYYPSLRMRILGWRVRMMIVLALTDRTPLLLGLGVLKRMLVYLTVLSYLGWLLRCLGRWWW